MEAAGADVLAVVTDVSSAEAVGALAQDTVERFGAEVLDTVKQRRFWILTHDEWMPAVADHCRALAEQRDPTLPPITPDA